MDQVTSPYEALQAAVAAAGSQAALARICGVSQPAVWKWLQSSKRLPPEHVLAVEQATDVSRHDLRPDIYPRDHVFMPHSCGIPPHRVASDTINLSHRGDA